jgi:hypothetical protein
VLGAVGGSCTFGPGLLAYIAADSFRNGNARIGAIASALRCLIHWLIHCPGPDSHDAQRNVDRAGQFRVRRDAAPEDEQDSLSSRC